MRTKKSSNKNSNTKSRKSPNGRKSVKRKAKSHKKKSATKRKSHARKHRNMRGGVEQVEQVKRVEQYTIESEYAHMLGLKSWDELTSVTTELNCLTCEEGFTHKIKIEYVGQPKDELNYKITDYGTFIENKTYPQFLQQIKSFVIDKQQFSNLEILFKIEQAANPLHKEPIFIRDIAMKATYTPK